jgi:hypothetical protein
MVLAHTTKQGKSVVQNRICDGQGGENCDETCPNYETREQRRAENQGRNRARNGK